MRIFIDFNFEAAHHLPHSFPDGHVNQRLHGHSFRARITLDGRPDPKSGLITDLGAVKSCADSAREELDHRYLNEVPGLELPTLETIAIWLWRRVEPDLPALVEIGIYRDSCGEGCEYNGEFETRKAAA
ncbi:6-carboxytetrahydropterin synthase [Phyllobacterium sp. BT25]|uniref:6-carboxy-5,6,7,8-tetrahydropterin synthase n=1 Tax=Phyllobacterium pellucidum TaxID=2740464 RepID=A0A849VWK4_9HYPH|nr:MULTISPECIES: 6-carboxytetrahydropterin synthase [Phyllobacterium]NTS32637.1 6-carboxytetrahydropterin synthase [Phyllobacterium pellucidum]SFI75630.1 6-pyruvoyltetrahydropterin/6-carboxytetrahydropterin synthase [Phyllobacterium sp. CL33Tsu]